MFPEIVIPAENTRKPGVFRRYKNGSIGQRLVTLRYISLP